MDWSRGTIRLYKRHSANLFQKKTSAGEITWIHLYLLIIIPIDINKDGQTQVLQMQEVDDDQVNKFLDGGNNMLEAVKANILIAQERQKACYDIKHSNPNIFEVGLTVLKKDFRRKKRAGGKLDPSWLGPYTIVKALGRGLYSLQGIVDTSKIISRVNGTHLKRYYQPILEPPVSSSQEINPLLQSEDLPNKSGDEEDFINPPVSFSMDNQSPWSSTSDISCIDECDPALNPQLDSPTCMKTITPDKFSNIPNVIGRKRSLIEQNTPNKKKKSSSQNVAAKNLVINRQRANNPKPEITLDLTKYTEEICEVTNKHKLGIWLEGDIYKLYKSDRDILLSPTAWLNDNIICAVQNILKQQMPLLQGLQAPSLGQTCSFDIVKQPFLQILHNGDDHWLLISTIGTKNAEVHVYDSIYQSVNIKVKEQIASLLYTQEEEIKLKFMNIQKQSGSNDCGIFAVANATLLSLGKNPGKYLMDQGLMRSHLYECFMKVPYYPETPITIRNSSQSTPLLYQFYGLGG